MSDPPIIGEGIERTPAGPWKGIIEARHDGEKWIVLAHPNRGGSQPVKNFNASGYGTSQDECLRLCGALGKTWPEWKTRVMFPVSGSPDSESN